MKKSPTTAILILTLNCNQFFQSGLGFVFHAPRKYRSSFHYANLPAKTQRCPSQRHQDFTTCRSSIMDDFSKEFIVTAGNENIEQNNDVLNNRATANKSTNKKQNNDNNKLPKKPRIVKHLYRYFTDISVECWLATACPQEFLQSCGYSEGELQTMSEMYPKLFSSSLDVRGHLAPKVRFLVNTLGGGTGDICSGFVEECSPHYDNDDDYCPHNLIIPESVKSNVPPKFFGMALERTVAPRHAYLVHHSDSLPHGQDLLANDAVLFKEFVNACDKPVADFVELCNRWSSSSSQHTTETFEAFSRVFNSGILSTARTDNKSDLSFIQCSPGKMAQLQLLHGANPIETDRVGIAPLQWMAGTGNMEGLESLLKTLVLAGEGEDVGDILLNSRKAKLGATALHWACAGVWDKKFGIGGHIDTCKFLLNKSNDQKTNLVNAETTSGSTPLMWACWAGSLDIVKLLLSNDANPHAKDKNGANAADWALYSGSMDVCKYLNEEFGIESSKFGP